MARLTDLSCSAMTVAEPRPPDPEAAVPDEPAEQVPEIPQCPFLTSSDGAWRMASAARDHRCAAVTPPAPLTTEKQRRLCLTAEHVGCATFVAAETTSSALPRRTAGLPRPVARTTPVILDQRRFAAVLQTMTVSRSVGQSAILAVLVVALLVVVIARSAFRGASTPSEPPLATAAASAGSSATAKPSSTPRPTATPGPTASPSATPAPSASTRPRATPRPTRRATPRPSKRASTTGLDSIVAGLVTLARPALSAVAGNDGRPLSREVLVVRFPVLHP